MRHAFPSSLRWPRPGTFTKVPIGGHILRYCWALSNHAMSDKKWGRQGRTSGPVHEHVREARSFLGEENCLQEKTSPPNSGRHRHFWYFTPLNSRRWSGSYSGRSARLDSLPDRPLNSSLPGVIHSHRRRPKGSWLSCLPLQCSRELVSGEQTGSITNWRAYLWRGWGCGAMSQWHYEF